MNIFLRVGISIFEGETDCDVVLNENVENETIWLRTWDNACLNFGSGSIALKNDE